MGGEAGSGKSRLVRELAHEVAAEGVLVLYGACDAVVQTPYRPFAEALDQLVAATDPEVLRADLGSAGGELARLVPDLPARVGGLPVPIAADPDTERHRLHTAVTDLLAGAGRRQPLLLVLEDAHWADTPRSCCCATSPAPASEARVLVLATFRDTEADVPAELADALADLRRSMTSCACIWAASARRTSGSSCAERAAARSSPAGARLLARDPRPHRGQRLPAVRALAGARGDGRARAPSTACCG